MRIVNTQMGCRDVWNGRLAVSSVEAALALGISQSTLRRLEQEGSLRPIRANRRVLYSVKALEAWLDGKVGMPATTPVEGGVAA
jgi:hypothetical protein